MHIFNQGICKSNRATRSKETAPVLSPAGSATELYLIFTMPENTTVTSQKRANDTLPQMPQSRAWVESFYHRCAGSMSLAGWEFPFWIFLRLKGCYFN